MTLIVKLFKFRLNYYYSPLICPPKISKCEQVTAFSEGRLSVTKDARVRALGTLLALLCQDHLDVGGLGHTFHTIDVHKLFNVPNVLVVLLTVWDHNKRNQLLDSTVPELPSKNTI